MAYENDIDDLLDPRDAKLEAEFRDLEREAEVTKLKRKMAGQGTNRARGGGGGGGSRSDDPLKDMKASLDDDDEAVRYILVMCPHCKAKNRTPLERVRTHLPRCGRCHRRLTFTR